MIPKIIHYCWFGRSTLPTMSLKCIESWRKYLPDYDIKEWNEDNFNVNIIPYTQEAYKMKKYAFVSDFARFYILYYHGGLYFDTDVEVIKHMDDIINCGPFMGCEGKAGATALTVAPGLGLGVNPGLGLYKEILDIYSGLHFVMPDGQLNLKTVVSYTTELLFTKGLKNINEIQTIDGVTIYPQPYFNPKDFYTGKIVITEKTYSIHHFSMSWLPRRTKCISNLKRWGMRVIGVKTVENVVAILKLFKKRTLS